MAVKASPNITPQASKLHRRLPVPLLLNISIRISKLNAGFYGRLAGAIAVICLLLSGYGFRWEPGQLWILPVNGLTFMVAGAVALGVSLWLLRPRFAFFSVAEQKLCSLPIRWRYVIAGTVAILMMAEGNSRYFVKWFRLASHLQALLFVGGAVLIVFGFGGFKGVSLRSLFRRSSLPLWFIVVVGFALRTWNLAESVHIMVDELHFYDGVVRLWTDSNLPLLQYLDGIAAYSHFFSYVEVWTVALFGSDFFGIRFASVLFGTLTIVAVYLLGRAMSDRKTGLMAAALLALFPPHIHFSRLAMNNIADPLFGTLAIAFLFSALRHHQQRDYVLAGLFLALSSYFYEGGRLLFPAVFGVWLVFVMIRSRFRIPWRGLAVMAFVAGVVVLPYYAYAFSQKNNVTPRLADEGRLGYLIRDLRLRPADDDFLKHYREAFHPGIFHTVYWSVDQVLLKYYDDALRPAIFHTIYSPDRSWFYYGGATPILPWYVVPFYLSGLFLLLFRGRYAGLLFWLWIVFALLGISLVVSTDWTVRFVVLFPVMMVVVAIGLRYPLEIIFPRLPRRLLTLIMVLLVVSLGAVQVSNYLGEHLRVYNLQIRQSMRDFYDVFDRASQFADVSTIIYITNDMVYTPVLDTSRVFRSVELTYDIWNLSDDIQQNLDDLSREQAYAFALVPDDAVTLDAVQAVFPLTAGPWSPYESVPLERQYALYLYQPPN